ncbi:signaling protein [Duganella sp. Leaf126]|uniref:bifunctional diguanylate cyclase/phosphodiesterase n=1 Tax=Duganella sp. Leaf126 TaxID=1736266 RepID=UPI0006F5BAA3|nr:EAL domain-containing protein [Duganella sp. Leaf126]KQQ32340.1 signaling protein [Duganella sp. Leaf126]
MPTMKVGNASLELLGQRTEWRFWSGLPLPLLTVALLLAIWGATWHFINIERDTTVRAVQASLADLVDTYEAQIARNVGGIEQTLKTVNYAVRVNGTANALEAMRNEDLLPPAIVFAVSVIDSDGRLVDTYPSAVAPAALTSLAAQPFFLRHRADPSDRVMVGAIHDGGQRPASVRFTKRLTDSAGHFAGVAMLTVDAGYFTSSYELSRLGRDGMLALSGEDGTILALRIGDNTSLAAMGDGVERYTAVHRIGRVHLSATAGLGKAEQMSGFAARRRAHLWQAAGASLAVLAVAAAFWGWNRQGAKTRRSIRMAQQTYEAASESNQDAFFVFHSVYDQTNTIVDFRIAAANRQAEFMTGASRHALHNALLLGVLPETMDNGVFDKLVRAATQGGVHEREIRNTVARFRGEWFHEQLVGVEGGVVAIVRDVSERKAAEAKILHMAQHDALTGLPNRALLQARLEAAVAEAAAGQRGDLVLVSFIDFDDFKMINDGLGHGAGDAVLSAIAARMLSYLRAQDTLGRFGGDEFVIVMPARHDELDQCLAMLGQLTAAVRQAVEVDGHAIRISCSTGTAVYPQHGASAGALLTRADVAMYSAKNAGKNQCRLYSEAMHAHAEDKLALVESLRAAVDTQQLQVVYQPKFDIRTGALFGVEALVRWQHPTRGAVSPAEFIPLAEETGIILDIGRWVLDTACAQSAAWQQMGLPPLVMSVNVSARQFDDATLLHDIAAALERSGLTPALLELEITESLIMRDLDKAVSTMRALQQMGLSMSIDDFGTGYSSLSSLKSFPITTLKLDKSFVADLAGNPEDQAIARAIIALAHELTLRVIAEGVETQAQLDFLKNNGCDQVQGYLFARPSRPDQVSALLAAQSNLLRPAA